MTARIPEHREHPQTRSERQVAARRRGKRQQLSEGLALIESAARKIEQAGSDTPAVRDYAAHLCDVRDELMFWLHEGDLT
jgi:hypothetical protein